MSRRLTAAEQRAIEVRAHFAKVTTANTAPPAGYEATCPKCGGPSNKTLVAAWGHCMACQRAAQNV